MKTQAVHQENGKRNARYLWRPDVSQTSNHLQRFHWSAAPNTNHGPAGCPGNNTPLQYSEQQASKETLLFFDILLPALSPFSCLIFLLSVTLSVSLLFTPRVWTKIWSGEKPLDGLSIRPRLPADELSPAGRTFTLNFTPHVLPACLGVKSKVVYLQWTRVELNPQHCGIMLKTKWIWQTHKC